MGHNLALKVLLPHLSVTTGQLDILASAAAASSAILGAELVASLLEHSPHSCTLTSPVQTKLLGAEGAV